MKLLFVTVVVFVTVSVAFAGDVVWEERTPLLTAPIRVR
jgi:hypothetical protein